MRPTRVFTLLAAVGLLAPLLAIGVGEARVGRTLERRIYDGWFNIRGPLPTPSDVAVVAIDVDSEQSLGRYPWSRDWHARLVRNLARAGAKVVAFDATFADEFPVQDTLLRRVIDSTGVTILGAKTNVIRHGESVGFSLEEPIGVLNGAPIGIVDNFVDPVDGVIREYPILHRYPQGTVPQLGVRAVLQYVGMPLDSAYATDDGWRVAGRSIPRGLGDAMLINFLGKPTTVSTYSYASVVDDVDTDIGDWDSDTFELMDEEGRFRNRIVFVGSTVPEHQDLHSTPFRNPDDAYGWRSSLARLLSGGEESAAVQTPGVEVHAHAAETILAGLTIAVLPRPVQYLWTLLLSLLVVSLTPRVRGVWGTASAVALVGVAAGAAWWLFVRDGVWLWTATPVLAVGMSYAGSTATLYLAEEQEKARIRGMFSRYVSASVVDELIKRPELVALGGEERVMTVLFSDLADFSTVSEGLTPTQLVSLLNEYLTAMTDIVIEHGGIIDKYQGDLIMAEFGAPLPLADHALRACRAALDMVAELGRLRERWAQEGRPLLTARIGINTGRMLVGNLGSRHFFDYTVMGDAVNLASRLEGANKPYGTRLMVSEFTWNEVKGELLGRELDRIRVKGKDQPVCVYEVMERKRDGLSLERLELVRHFEGALALYQEARFEEARDAFHSLARRFPDDGPTALYEQRCAEYAVDPPPAGWDGVYTMKTK